MPQGEAGVRFQQLDIEDVGGRCTLDSPVRGEGGLTRLEPGIVRRRRNRHNCVSIVFGVFYPPALSAASMSIICWPTLPGVIALVILLAERWTNRANRAPKMRPWHGRLGGGEAGVLGKRIGSEANGRR